jgi:glycosyltransferase involved in cell wall biosynthesis
MRAEVEAAANSHSHISYLGTLSQSRLVEVLGDAEFVVVPTRGVESFGRVVVEAMATGTPAIVADHGGLRETTANSGAGLRFPPGDVAALVASVRKLRDGGDLRTMRIAARRHFEERFSGAVVLQRWVDLYRQATEGWR